MSPNVPFNSGLNCMQEKVAYTYVFSSDQWLPGVELCMSSKQLQQRRQILARLNVDLSLQQVCNAITLQTETKQNWAFTEFPTWLTAETLIELRFYVRLDTK